MNRKILKLMFSFLVVFSLIFTVKVDAATFHSATKWLTTASFGIPGNTGTGYNKKIDGSIAYCPEFGRSAIPDGTKVESFGSIYNRNSLVAGQIITIGRAKYTGEKRYMYISQAMNCFYKYSKSNLKGCTDTINNMVDSAISRVNNYKFISGSSTDNLPKLTIKASNSTMTKTANSTRTNATFVSSPIEIKGLESSNYGGNKESIKVISTKPSYKVSLSSAASGSAVKLCKNAAGTSGCITNDGSITDNGNYYLIVTNAGATGGSASIKINGSNQSHYPSVKRWKSGSSQRFVTYTEKAVFKRSVNASASLRYSSIDGSYSASVMKTDDTGEGLPGASLRLFTAADAEGKNDTVTLCTTNPNDANGSCSKTGIQAGDANKYSTGRFICYSEETTPKGYINISTHCDPITLGNSTNYYKTESNGDGEIAITQEVYEESRLYTQGDKQYQFHVGSGTAASDYEYGPNPVKYKYEYSDGRPIEYYDDDSLYKHIDGDNVSWYDVNADTGEHININVTQLDNESCEIKSVCRNEHGVSENTDYCSGEYQFNFVTFSSGNATINVGNALNFVSISKKAISGDDEVPGATLSIFKADNDGKCSSELAKAKKFIYTPFEAPEGGGSSEGDSSGGDESSDGQSGEDETQDQETDEGTDEGQDVANSGLRWVSSNTPATVYGLEAGNYCLQEELPPSGFKVSPTIVKFTMTESGEVTNVSNDLYDEENKILIVNDEYTSFSISKADMATTKEIPGAELKICAAAKNDKGEYEPVTTESGEVGKCEADYLADGTQAIWTSGTEPHQVVGLPAGAYYLVETTAPNGYVKAESILFILTDDGKLTDSKGNSLENNKLTMYDDYAHVPPTLANIPFVLLSTGVILVATGVGGYLWTEKKKKNSSLS